MNTNGRPVFIKLGDTRIKLNNIKDYGVSKAESWSTIYNIDIYTLISEDILFGLSKSIQFKKSGQYQVELSDSDYVDNSMGLHWSKEDKFWMKVHENYEGKIYVCRCFVHVNDYVEARGYIAFRDKNSFDIILNSDRKREISDEGISSVYCSWTSGYQEIRRHQKISKYLYITTYQNDHYIFYEDEVDFNINEKLNLLDDWLSA